MDTINYYWFSLFLAMNGFILVLLAINVSRLRLRHRISIGDGDNKSLATAIRVHANGVEQVPIFALLLLALSVNDSASSTLAALCLSFTLARLLHALGMLFKVHICRRLGAALTYFLQVFILLLLALRLV
jgi:uncharacterized protein